MTEGLPFAFPEGEPAEPDLLLISRIACAPKLTRRANGLAGLDETGGPSLSSKGDSSSEPLELPEMLCPRDRMLSKGDCCVGEVPSPAVATDRRRC